MNHNPTPNSQPWRTQSYSTPSEPNLSYYSYPQQNYPTSYISQSTLLYQQQPQQIQQIQQITQQAYQAYEQNIQGNYPSPPNDGKFYNSVGMMKPQAYVKYFYQVEEYLNRKRNTFQQATQQQENHNTNHYQIRQPQPQIQTEKINLMSITQVQNFIQQVEKQPSSVASLNYDMKYQFKHTKHDPIVIESQSEQQIDMEEQVIKGYGPQNKNMEQRQYMKQKVNMKQTSNKQIRALYSLKINDSSIQNNSATQAKPTTLNKRGSQQSIPLIKSTLSQVICQKSLTHLVQPLIPQTNHTNQTNKSPKAFHQSSGRIIPLSQILLLCDQILLQLNMEGLPDPMVKMFIKYKVMELRQKYQETINVSNRIYKVLKVYQSFIWFEKDRKYFMDKVINQHIFQCVDFKYQQVKRRQLLTLKDNDLLYSRKQDQLYKTKQDLLYTKNLQIQLQSIHQQDISSSSRLKSQKSNQQSNQNQIQIKSNPTQKQRIQQDNDQGPFDILKSKKIQKPVFSNSFNNSQFNDRKLRQRKKKRGKRDRQGRDGYKQKEERNVHQKHISKQDQADIQKIQRWADKVIDNDRLKKPQQKPNKPQQSLIRPIPSRSPKPIQPSKRIKQRGNKATQLNFLQVLQQKLSQLTQSQQTKTSLESLQNSIPQINKQMKNNESHGKIRIGKEYYQAKMPQFIRQQQDFQQIRKDKITKLMERKVSVMTF